MVLGVDAASWPYWRGNPAPLSTSPFGDITTLMDFGIVIGATLAASLSARFDLRPINAVGQRGPARPWAGC